MSARAAAASLLSAASLAAVCGACSASSPPAQFSSLGDGGGFPVIGPQKDTERCGAGITMCLYGTAQTHGYASAPVSMRASLYRVFPSALDGAAGAVPNPIAAELVARDGTWAFEADAAGNPLDAWGHYYVEVVPTFGPRQTRAVSTRVGPLALSGAGAAPVAIVVKPVQLDLLEQGADGIPMATQWATAHVFDPSSGDELPAGGATATLWIGDQAVPLAAVQGGTGYAVQFPNSQFPQAPAAMATYRVTTSQAAGSAGSGASTDWTLVASPPSFTGQIASPAPSASIAAGAALPVSWPVQPDADYVLVELFRREGTAWQKAYASPSLDPPNVNIEKIPGTALAMPGTYLLNVAFTKSNCPAGGDGCVHASTVANEELTVQ